MLSRISSPTKTTGFPYDIYGTTAIAYNNGTSFAINPATVIAEPPDKACAYVGFSGRFGHAGEVYIYV